MPQRFLIVWLIALSAVAYEWPIWFAGAWDPFLASKPHLSWFIAATMFAVGCLLRNEELDQTLRDWRSVALGTAVQYSAMPALGFGMGRLFGLSPDAMIGIVIVGCVPGAMASNVLTLLARGNVSYSVSLTTTATLLAPVVVPVGLRLFLAADVSLDVKAVFLNLLATVAGPVIVGHGLCRVWGRLRDFMSEAGPGIAHATILWVIAVVVATNRGQLDEGDGRTLGALLAVNGLGYLAGYLAGWSARLPEPMRRALTLEVGMQNAGLGTALAAKFFPDHPAAMIPTALYTFGCMLTGAALAQWWSRRLPADAQSN